MNLNQDNIFKALIASLQANSVCDCNYSFLNNFSKTEWQSLYQLSARQGVLAIVWSAIGKLANEGKLTPEQMPDKALKLQWALSAEKIKNRYNKQRQLAEKLADAFAEEGIDTYVLKGLAISGYYPIPEYRECGDLDCYSSYP